MRTDAMQLKKLRISSPATLERMQQHGWCDTLGSPVVWFQWQRPNHDSQFEEEKEKKPRKEKFNKNRKGETRQVLS